MTSGPLDDVLLAALRHSVGNVSEAGLRIRAALALTGKQSAEVAPELNISSRTLDRTMNGERQPRDWEISRLAEVLRVPEWFLRDGFDGQPDQASFEDARLLRIGEELSRLASAVETGLLREEVEGRQDQDPAPGSLAEAVAALGEATSQGLAEIRGRLESIEQRLPDGPVQQQPKRERG